MHNTISVIIPVYNEEKALPTLYRELINVLTQIGSHFEIVFVDDGSQDNSAEIIYKWTQQNKHTKLIQFKRNCGQTAAIQAGILNGNGSVFVFLDADGQNDPADIPKLIKKLDEGFDVVSGWRTNRKDKNLMRVLPSRCANWLISNISGVHLHDYGCTLKAYKRSIIRDITLFGEMHRFIPAHAALAGACITELPVNHRPRTTGKSKYGISRIFRVILDLLVIKFLMRYAERPMHFFGGVGLIMFLLATIAAIIAFVFKFTGIASFIETPLPTISIFFVTVGVIFLLMGIIAEILLRVQFEINPNKHKQKIKRTINLED